MGLCAPFRCRIKWTPGRYWKALSMQDDSVFILMPQWPFDWETFPTGFTYRSRGRWMWFDHPSPSEIVMGDGASELTRTQAETAPFPWIRLTATIERVSELYLPEAVLEDFRPDVGDKIISANGWGGPLAASGRLFAGIEFAPLRVEGLPDDSGTAAIRNFAEWQTLDGGCRITVGEPRKPLGPKGTIRDHVREHLLLRDDNGWTAENGPHPSQAFVMYPAGKPGRPTGNSGFAVTEYASAVMQTLHTFRIGQRICSGIKIPEGSTSAFIDSGDSEVFGLWPSLGFVLLRNEDGSKSNYK